MAANPPAISHVVGDISPGSTTSSAPWHEAKTETYVSASATGHRCDNEPKFGSVQVSGGPWKPTWLRLGPLAGLLALLTSMSSILVSLGILIGSRGQAKSSWTIPPSSWLAVCTAVANQAVRFAAFHGVATAWWYRATRGSTVARLHSDWYAGTHIVGAIAAGRHMGLLGLACIFSTLVALDGPFMQRATSIKSAPILHEKVSLNLSITPEISHGSTGYYFRNDDLASRPVLAFNSTIPSADGTVPNNVAVGAGPFFSAKVLKRYSKGETTLPSFITGCSTELCKAKVKAPALASTSCASRFVAFDMSMVRNDPISLGSLRKAETAPPLEQMTFVIYSSLVLGERESINLVTGSAKLPHCPGLLNLTSCTLESAIGEYDVTIRSNVATLDQPVEPKIIAMANNTQVFTKIDPDYSAYPSTLAGIVSATNTQWATYAVVFKEPGNPAKLSHASNYEVSEQFIRWIPPDDCFSYADAREQVLASMNELMFLTGVLDPTRPPRQTTADYYRTRLDPGLEVNSTIIGNMLGTHEVYDTNLRFFMLAAIVELVCIALVLPTYMGFWKLGRRVTFSPLEIAKAFEAPLFENCHSNSSATDIVKVIGREELRYGVVREEDGANGGRLAFAPPTQVKGAERGERFKA